MILSGTIIGDAAKKFNSHSYRVPELLPLTLFSVDPKRVNPLHEYPRWEDKPESPNLPYTTRLDYEVRFKEKEGQGYIDEMTIYLKPNKYTLDKNEIAVYRCELGGVYVDRYEIAKKALYDVFRDKDELK